MERNEKEKTVDDQTPGGEVLGNPFIHNGNPYLNLSLTDHSQGRIQDLSEGARIFRNKRIVLEAKFFFHLKDSIKVSKLMTKD